MKKSFLRYLLPIFIFIVALCSFTACGLGGAPNDNPEGDNPTPPSTEGTFYLDSDLFTITQTDTPLTLVAFLALNDVNVQGYYSTANSGDIVYEQDMEYDFSQVDTSVAGNYTVTASYRGQAKTFTVYVQAPNEAEILLDTTSVQKQFAYAENFNSDGLKVYVCYDNGTQKQLSADAFTVDAALYNKVHGGSTALSCTIRISYKYWNKEYTVTVAPRPADEVLDIYAFCQNEFYSNVYPYGETYQASDFQLAFLVKRYDWQGEFETVTISELPYGAPEHSLAIDKTHAFNAEHGIEEDQTYTLTLGWGALETTIDVIVEKAPPHITAVTVQQTYQSLSVPYGTRDLTACLNGLCLTLHYSYGNDTYAYYSPTDAQFAVDDTNFNCEQAGTYHVDIYYKGFRAKSGQNQLHDCGLGADFTYGVDVTVNEKGYTPLERCEYLFIDNSSTHKTEYYRGENIDLTALKQDLAVYAVDYNGNVTQVLPEHFNLTYDQTTFDNTAYNVPQHMNADGTIKNVPTPFAHAMTVSLNASGRAALSCYNADAYADITFNVYRMPDKILQSLVPFGDNTAKDVTYSRTGYSSSLFAGLQFLATYASGEQEILTVQADGTLDKFNGAVEFSIPISYNNMPDAVFEGGLLCNVAVSVSYDVYAYVKYDEISERYYFNTSDDVYQSEKGLATHTVNASVKNIAKVSKTPELKGMYIDHKNSNYKVIYTSGEQFNASGFTVYGYYDYAKLDPVIIPTSDYKFAIPANYYNAATKTFTNGDTACTQTVSLTYAPDGVSGDAYNLTVNNAANKAGAKFNICLLPTGAGFDGGYNLNFENLSLNDTEYVIFVDNQLGATQATFDVKYYIDKVGFKTLTGFTAYIENGAFKLVSKVDNDEQEIEVLESEYPTSVSLKYAYSDTVTLYGSTTITWKYACNATQDEYAIDTSKLQIKTEYQQGETLVAPDGTLIITQNGVFVLEKNLADLLAVDRMEAADSYVLEGADIITAYAGAQGTYDVTLRWMHYYRKEYTPLLTYTYTITVLANEQSATLLQNTPARYALKRTVESGDLQGEPLFVTFNDQPFAPVLSENANAYTYRLASGLLTYEQFLSATYIDEIDDFGFYTLRVNDEAGNVALYHVQNCELPDVFTTLTVNGKAVTAYVQTAKTYEDTTLDLGFTHEITLCYQPKDGFAVSVTDALSGDNIFNNTPFNVTANSMQLLINLINDKGETYASFTLELIVGSPVLSVNINGVNAERTEETFTITLPAETQKLQANVQLAQGYTATITQNGVDYTALPPLLGANEYDINLYYLGKFIGVCKLQVTLPKPDFFNTLKLYNYNTSNAYDLSTDDTIIAIGPLASALPNNDLHLKLKTNDPYLKVNIKNLAGDVLHVVNNSEYRIPAGKSDFYLEFIKDGKSYLRGLTVYKNGENHNQIVIDELTERIAVSAFGSDGARVNGNTYYVPVSEENLRMANAKSLTFIINDRYAYDGSETLFLDSIVGVDFDRTTYRYACKMQYHNAAYNTFNRFVYVYLMPIAQMSDTATAQVQIGENTLDFSDFAWDEGQNAYAATLTMEKQNALFGVTPLHGATVNSVICLLSENGAVKNEGNLTNGLLTTQSGGLHDVQLLAVGDSEISVIFSVCSQDKSQFTRYIVIIACNT